MAFHLICLFLYLVVVLVLKFYFFISNVMPWFIIKDSKYKRKFPDLMICGEIYIPNDMSKIQYVSK